MHTRAAGMGGASQTPLQVEGLGFRVRGDPSAWFDGGWDAHPCRTIAASGLGLMV